jgi:putative transposase
VATDEGWRWATRYRLPEARRFAFRKMTNQLDI